MKRTGATNENLKGLVKDLKKSSYSQEAGIWKRVASDLEMPSRQRRVVNLSRLNRFTKDNETVVVPGKVLGAGSISHSIVIAALAFSENAKEQIEKAKGKCIREKDAKRRYLMVPIGAVPGNLTKEMAEKIDTESGRHIYNQRIAIVEPVFANIRHMKRLDRFTLRGKIKVDIQWMLYCMVHNICKIVRYGTV